MFGGVGKAAGCVLVAGGVILSGSISAKAADLGGDCCADLEERVAELEATTARKGNRKVSLKISGWVNEQLLFWDDEIEQNVYVGNNDQERSRFKFAGDAKINSEWSAGYTLEIGVRTTRSSNYSQTDADGTPLGALDIRKSSWFIKSKKLGKLTVGRDGSATYHILDDADITNTRYYADAESMPTIGANSFFLTTGGFTSGLRWSSILSTASNRSPGNGERPDIIRYNSPEFGGFEVVAAWGKDDLWDVALVYEGKAGDFELAGRVGYAEYTDEGTGPGTDHCLGPNGTVSGIKCKEFGASGTIWHKPSGLYVYGAYGQLQDDRWAANAIAPFVDDEDRLYYVQLGIEKKWMELGKTTIFGTYRHDDVGTRGTFVGATGLGTLVNNANYTVLGSEVDTWGGGIVQNVDKAAMDLYLIYSHIDGEFDAFCNGGGCVANSVTTVDLNSLQLIQAGARIQF